MPRFAPSATAIGLGAAAAYVRKMDVDKGRVKLSNQWGTYLELGSAAAGLVTDLMRLGVNREVTDALAIGGLTLTSERLTRSAMSGSFGTGSPMAMNGRSYAGAPLRVGEGAVPFARGFATKVPSVTIY